jgi:hypothetical protein
MSTLGQNRTLQNSVKEKGDEKNYRTKKRGRGWKGRWRESVKERIRRENSKVFIDSSTYCFI